MCGNILTEWYYGGKGNEWMKKCRVEIDSFFCCNFFAGLLIPHLPFEIEHMDISSFPCTQLVFAFSLGWTLKEVNINGDFNQYIWAFSLGWTQETDVRVTSSSLLISSGKPEEVFPTNIFSVLNECPPLSTEPKLFNTIPTQFLLSHFYPHWFSTEPNFYWPVCSTSQFQSGVSRNLVGIGV